jgi:hypothetical protein
MCLHGSGSKKHLMMWAGMIMTAGSSMPPRLEKRMRYSPICATHTHLGFLLPGPIVNLILMLFKGVTELFWRADQTLFTTTLHDAATANYS